MPERDDASKPSRETIVSLAFGERAVNNFLWLSLRGKLSCPKATYWKVRTDICF
jgi:hypothetical protein